MTGRVQRRRFTKEFKTEAVELAQRSDKKMVTIAQGLGIRPELLYRWKSEYMLDKDQAFPGTGHLRNSTEEQVRYLERELISIQEENNILKKALAIFSRVPK